MQEVIVIIAFIVVLAIVFYKVFIKRNAASCSSCEFNQDSEK